MECDVIIPLGIGSKYDDLELRYCLRSLSKNFRCLGNIYLIGHKPNWVKNVIYIEFEDIFKFNKDANLINKTLYICSKRSVSKNVMRISDDQVLLKPLICSDIKPLHKGDLNGAEFVQLNNWGRRVKNTFELLFHHDLSTFFYETHIPVIYDKSEFIKIMGKQNWAIEKGGYTINTLYFNQLKNNIPIKISNEKLEIEGEVKNKEQILKELDNKNLIYLGYDEGGFNKDLIEILQILFPDKSQFEI